MAAKCRLLSFVLIILVISLTYSCVLVMSELKVKSYVFWKLEREIFYQVTLSDDGSI